MYSTRIEAEWRRSAVAIDDPFARDCLLGAEVLDNIEDSDVEGERSSRVLIMSTSLTLLLQTGTCQCPAQFALLRSSPSSAQRQHHNRHQHRRSPRAGSRLRP